MCSGSQAPRGDAGAASSEIDVDAAVERGKALTPDEALALPPTVIASSDGNG